MLDNQKLIYRQKRKAALIGVFHIGIGRPFLDRGWRDLAQQHICGDIV